MNTNTRPPQDIPPEIRKIFQWIEDNLSLAGLLPILLIVFYGVYSSFYTVQPSEEGVVIKMGRYDRNTPPGLHFLIPFGVEEVEKVKTKLVLQEEFGFRTTILRRP